MNPSDSGTHTVVEHGPALPRDEQVEVVPTSQLTGAVSLSAAEWERVLWWLHKPLPPGPAKALDEAIIRKITTQRADAVSVDDLPPVRAFGTWDAPITDGAVWIDVPTGLACIHCGEPFAESDNGAIMPMGHAEHRECSLRSVLGGIGHHVDHARYCHSELGPDAGLPFRVSAWLVWLQHHGTPIEESLLEALRACLKTREEQAS